MSEILTFEEMQHLYAGEWLLIAYTELDDKMNIIQGKVLAHSPTRDDIYSAISSRDEKSVAIEYVGAIPEDKDVIGVSQRQHRAKFQDKACPFDPEEWKADMKALTERAEKIPVLSPEVFTRESIYGNHG